MKDSAAPQESEIKRHLFYETSHSPSVADLVGYEKAKEITDFCFIVNPYCGVPGLRLGYCYSGNLTLLSRLRRHVPTWNINTLAEYFLSLLPPTDAEYKLVEALGSLMRL